MKKPSESAPASHHHHPARHQDTGAPFDGVFDGFLEARQLCGGSERPLRDAARGLIELGAPELALITARHVTGRLAPWVNPDPAIAKAQEAYKAAPAAARGPEPPRKPLPPPVGLPSFPGKQPGWV